MIKIRKRYRFLTKIQRTVRHILKMEAKGALALGFSFVHFQVRIRPRLRLISLVLALLVLLHMGAFTFVFYARPKEAEIKIFGQAILVASDNEASDQVPASEISQTIDFSRSPFEFAQPVNGYLSGGYSSYHPAHDITADLDAPIHPVGGGVVEFGGRVFDGKGNVVIVDHGDGLKSLYAHMGKINVGVGNLVEPATVLGTVGLTGRTTGPHVHLEIYDNGVIVNPANVLP